MFDSAIIDVAIGLSFIFLLLSLLVTAASELLSGWLKWRSTHLWEGLKQLLQSEAARNRLYAHPLVKGLTRVDIARPEWKDGANGPSYIPSRTFALALIDILRQPHKAADDVEKRLRAAVHQATDPATVFAAVEGIARDVAASNASDAVKHDVGALAARLLPPVDAGVVTALKQQVRAAVDRVPPGERDAAGAAVIRWLNENADRAANYVELRAGLAAAVGSLPLAGSTSATEQLRAVLQTIVNDFVHGKPENAVREVQTFASGAARRWLQGGERSLEGTLAALSPLLDDAAGDIDRFRENIEIWFNDGMDRVSGWYKRHIAMVHGVIGVALAISMNIDALQITRTLWREPTLRKALVANAERFAEERSADVKNPPPATSAMATGKTPTADQRFTALREQIGTLGLPIGWSCGSDTKSTADSAAIGGPFWCSTAPRDYGWAVWFKDIFAMVIGWLITAAAVSLGAPFWFDMLKRVISIRATGKAPEEKPLSPKEVPQPREPGQRPREADLLNALRR